MCLQDTAFTKKAISLHIHGVAFGSQYKKVFLSSLTHGHESYIEHHNGMDSLLRRSRDSNHFVLAKVDLNFFRICENSSTSANLAFTNHQDIMGVIYEVSGTSAPYNSKKCHSITFASTLAPFFSLDLLDLPLLLPYTPSAPLRFYPSNTNLIPSSSSQVTRSS